VTPAPDVEDLEDLMFVDADIEADIEADLEADIDTEGPQPPTGTG
jgi:hypothetical protein